MHAAKPGQANSDTSKALPIPSPSPQGAHPRKQKVKNTLRSVYGDLTSAGCRKTQKWLLPTPTACCIQRAVPWPAGNCHRTDCEERGLQSICNVVGTRGTQRKDCRRCRPSIKGRLTAQGVREHCRMVGRGCGYTGGQRALWDGG